MPWSGNRANLEIVAGADDLLTYFDTEKKNREICDYVIDNNKLDGEKQILDLI